MPSFRVPIVSALLPRPVGQPIAACCHPTAPVHARSQASPLQSAKPLGRRDCGRRSPLDPAADGLQDLSRPSPPAQSCMRRSRRRRRRGLVGPQSLHGILWRAPASVWTSPHASSTPVDENQRRPTGPRHFVIHPAIGEGCDRHLRQPRSACVMCSSHCAEIRATIVHFIRRWSDGGADQLLARVWISPDECHFLADGRIGEIDHAV